MRLLMLALLASAACGGPLDDIQVTSAQLSDTSWSQFAVIGGYSWSPATLTLVDTAGELHEVAVDIGGPVVGIVFDFSTGDSSGDEGLECLFQSSASLIIPEGEVVSGGELTGGYFGSTTGAHLVLGGTDHDLANGAGVKLKGGAVNLGMGMMVGFEWLDIGVKD